MDTNAAHDSVFSTIGEDGNVGKVENYSSAISASGILPYFPLFSILYLVKLNFDSLPRVALRIIGVFLMSRRIVRSDTFIDSGALSELREHYDNDIISVWSPEREIIFDYS